jgi:hypothetical protein
MKLYMFRTVPLSIIQFCRQLALTFEKFRKFEKSMHLVGFIIRIYQDGALFHRDPARKLSAKLYDIYHCCVYSEKLLMMDRGAVRNM